MNKLILFFLFFLMLLISGCEKSEIVNSTEKDYPYYLEGYLEAGRYALLHINRTIGIFSSYHDFDKYVVMTDDSAAKLYKNLNVHALLLKDGVVVDSLTGPYNDGSDYWRLRFYEDSIPEYRWWYLKGKSHKIEAGGNYQMVVKIGSNPEMVASCRVPGKVKIQLLESAHSCYPDEYKVAFTDPIEQNFYALECYTIRKKHGKWPLNGWIRVPFCENPLFDNNLSPALVNLPIFSDKIFNGHQESIVVRPTNLVDGLFCINLVSISEGYYQRLKSMYLFEKNLSNMYASPVQVYSNFTNATGFLAGRNVSSDTMAFQVAYIDAIPWKSSVNKYQKENMIKRFKK